MFDETFEPTYHSVRGRYPERHSIIPTFRTVSQSHSLYTNCAVIINNIQSCDIPTTCFGLYRPSLGRYLTQKKYLLLTCHKQLQMHTLKSLHIFTQTVFQAYFLTIFTDFKICIFNSYCCTTVTIYCVLCTFQRMADKGRNMQQACHPFVYNCI